MEQGIKFSEDFIKNLQAIDDNFETEIVTEEARIESEQKCKDFWSNSPDSGIPARFRKSSFENYVTETEEEKRNLKACISFSENKGRQMLFFVGKYGNGKTHLGCAIVRDNVNNARFTSSFEICTRYEMGSDFKATENKWQVLERYVNYNLLVIDELGRAKPEIEKLIIPYVINARYENEKKTVLITNLEKEKAIELLGEATVDRLKEICSTLSFNEESKRGKINE